MKKQLLFAIMFSLLLIYAMPVMAQDKIKKLILSGPKSTVTHPMAYIIEAGLLDDVAEEVELIIWNNPDQLRSLIAGGQVHFAAVPTYVAAVFANRGVEVQLLNVSVWGILWMVSSDPDINTIADLKGEEISMPYRNDMPDLIFRILAKQQNLDPATDFKLRYRASMPAVAQDVLSGRTTHGLLAEPLVSVALMKSAEISDRAPKLYRSVNLQEEWGKTFNRIPRIPQAGISATPKITGKPHVVEAFQRAYQEAVIFLNNNPEEASEIIVKYISGLKAAPVAAAIKNAGLNFVSAEDGREELEYFYKILKNFNPAKIGGKPPGDEFYWSSPKVQK